jgi:hypothetical protein
MLGNRNAVSDKFESVPQVQSRSQKFEPDLEIKWVYGDRPIKTPITTTYLSGALVVFFDVLKGQYKSVFRMLQIQTAIAC